MAQEWITQAEYARRKGFSRQYVNRLVKAGKIPVNAQGKIDPLAANCALSDNADPARAEFTKQAKADAEITPHGTASGAEEMKASRYQDARTLREQANAEKAMLELKQLQGELVEKQLVEKEVVAIYRDFREKMMRLPRQLAGKMATLKTEREVAAYLEEGIHGALNQFADQLESDSECLPTHDASLPPPPHAAYGQPNGLV